jgi:hypothetical protein
MALQITRKKDERVIHAFTHKLADIPNGVNVATADFAQTYLKEGTPVGMDSNGLYHIVKTAELSSSANNTATTLTVKKGHNLKVGDFVFAVIGGKSYAVTGISTNESDSTKDDITIGTTLGVAIAAGAVIVQGASSGATAGAYKYTPVGLVGESYDVDSLTNRPANVVTIGQVKKTCIPALGIVSDALKGIVLI